MKKVLVTSNTDLDLDGFSCVYAYAEFLRKTGTDAVGAVFGRIDKETIFVVEKFGIPWLDKGEDVIGECGDVVLVDTSNIKGLPNGVSVYNVVEIIDHRRVNDSNKFPNAKVQIEIIGAAATLVAERFFKNDVDISIEAAALLYSGIVSNTINFKASSTSDKDRKISDWLKSKLDISNNYVHDMFVYKSKIDVPLKKFFVDDLTYFEFNGNKMTIAQIEIVNLDKFVNDRLSEIKQALVDIKNNMSLDLIFLNGIDIESGYNMYVVVDDFSEKVLKSVRGLDFQNGVAKKDGVMMRKEVSPLIAKFLDDVHK